ncbi:hypothetical protein TNCV_2827011 [Trichonephila clavipes]|nr:hypothetical protein TNCV_2827011 [Trichonephila clavipes]
MDLFALELSVNILVARYGNWDLELGAKSGNLKSFILMILIRAMEQNYEIIVVSSVLDNRKVKIRKSWPALSSSVVIENKQFTEGLMLNLCLSSLEVFSLLLCGSLERDWDASSGVVHVT